MTGSARVVALRRIFRRHRRAIAAMCAAFTVFFGIAAVRPPAPAVTEVWAAARDLPGGAPLSPADVRPLLLPAGSAPAGVLPLTTAVAGRLLAGPVRRGEALTDVRLLGPGLLSGYGPGTVVTPVRLDDAATTGLLSTGDRVDVLAATAADELSARQPPLAARVVAAAVQVVTVPVLDPAGQAVEGGLVLLATSARQAAALAQAQAAERLSLVLVHPSPGQPG